MPWGRQKPCASPRVCFFATPPNSLRALGPSRRDRTIMDRQTLKEYLEWAETRAAQADSRVAEQRKLVTKLERERGHTAEARRLLAELELSLKMRIATGTGSAASLPNRALDSNQGHHQGQECQNGRERECARKPFKAPAFAAARRYRPPGAAIAIRQLRVRREM